MEEAGESLRDRAPARLRLAARAPNPVSVLPRNCRRFMVSISAQKRTSKDTELQVTSHKAYIVYSCENRSIGFLLGYLPAALQCCQAWRPVCSDRPGHQD